MVVVVVVERQPSQTHRQEALVVGCRSIGDGVWANVARGTQHSGEQHTNARPTEMIMFHETKLYMKFRILDIVTI